MGHTGVRRRMKVRWMHSAAEGYIGPETHAFNVLTGGVLRDYAMCGLPLVSMHHWNITTKPGGTKHPQCHPCKQAVGKGGRA